MIFFVVASLLAFTTSSPTLRAVAAYHSLQEWYDPATGLWETTGWWNAANLLTTLSNLALVEATVSDDIKIVIENTFRQAPAANPTTCRKTVDSKTFLISTTWCDTSKNHGISADASALGLLKDAKGKSGWLNDYYDDEAWWALAWIRAYDLTSNVTYLDAAEEIFEDLLKGRSTLCGGGMWWNKQHTYVNAITNELFIAVAASLANRVAFKKSQGLEETPQIVMGKIYKKDVRGRARDEYLAIASRHWIWFTKSSMINTGFNINDGLNKSCLNNGATVWSYNQGVILEGLSELYKATAKTDYLAFAIEIAEAGMKKLTAGKGILRDACEDWGCGADGVQFKGVFVRGLTCLLAVMEEGSLKSYFRKFVKKNAESVWLEDRDRNGKFGVHWSGPLQEVNAGSHGSGLDTLVAAVALSTK